MSDSGDSNQDEKKNRLDNLFEQAEKQKGTVEAEDHLNAFYGRSRRLGHTGAPSPYIAPSVRQVKKVTLNVFANGYVIDDGPLQPFNTPESDQFFKELESGFVPGSLASQYPDCDVDLVLNDYQFETYKAPSYTAFQGVGRRLEEGAPQPPAIQPTTPGAVLTVDESAEDVTVIRLVKLDGSTKEFKVNATKCTIRDLYSLAYAEEPTSSGLTLVVRSVPPYTLTEDKLDETVESAKLKRAVISIRK